MMLLAKTAPTGTTTLIIAVVGLALAAASIAWQAATFVLAGSRVRVDILRGAIGRGMLVTAPPEHWTTNAIAIQASQGITQEVVAVDVRNVGRMAATVQKLTVYIEDGVGFAPTGTDPSLPFRLEASSSEKWWVDAAAVSAGLVASKLSPSSKVYIEVALGTGKTIKTKSIAWVNR